MSYLTARQIRQEIGQQSCPCRPQAHSAAFTRPPPDKS
jgi:hypothetical protein